MKPEARNARAKKPRGISPGKQGRQQTKTAARAGVPHIEFTGYILAAVRELARHQALRSDEVLRWIQSRYGVRIPYDSFGACVDELNGLVERKGDEIVLSPELLVSRRSPYFDARQANAMLQKQAVAAHVHDTVLSKLDAVFMDAGSANEAIAREMARGDRGPLTVMTNNMRAVRAFLLNSSIRVLITGGIYITEDEALVGDGAIFDFNRFSFRVALVGASRLTATHVYNHGIVGEEEIKKMYWQIPAEKLIVPAALAKFDGKDISCFGELFRDPASSSPDSGRSIQSIALNELDETRARYHDLLIPAATSSLPRFRAKECTIVIEPKWMIDEDYRGKDAMRESLERTVGVINDNTRVTGVRVVHADVTKRRLGVE